MTDESTEVLYRLVGAIAVLFVSLVLLSITAKLVSWCSLFVPKLTYLIVYKWLYYLASSHPVKDEEVPRVLLSHERLSKLTFPVITDPVNFSTPHNIT